VQKKPVNKGNFLKKRTEEKRSVLFLHVEKKKYAVRYTGRFQEKINKIH